MTRKIKCPVCRRPIYEDKYREHLLTHKTKLPRHLKRNRRHKSSSSATTTTPTLQKSSSIPFDEVWKKYQKELPKKSQLSKKNIQDMLEVKLKENEITYNSLTIEATQGMESLEITFQDENRNLVLKYGIPFMNSRTEDQIEAILTHEICHVITLPTTNISTKDVGTIEQQMLMVDYMTSYDEYLAHVEFIKRYGDTKLLEELINSQKTLFNNFDNIMNAIRNRIVRNGTQLNKIIHSIIYDILLFFIVGERHFFEWCEETDLNSLYEFANYIYEDFEYIRNLNLTHHKTRDLVEFSLVLSISINPFIMMYENRIEFAETAENFHLSLLDEGDAETFLVGQWEERRSQKQV
jgi:hypothetical protein